MPGPDAATPPPRSLLRVTRPQPQADQWVSQLQASGFAAQALPLLVISPAQLPDGAIERLRQLAAPEKGAGADQTLALMFVSGQAVFHFDRLFKHYIAANGVDTAVSTIKTRAWCTGPGTAQALQRIGWPEQRIDSPPAGASLDSEGLWPLAEPQLVCARAAQTKPPRVLIVRGGDAQGQPQGRDWLAQRIVQAGGAVDTLVAYHRLPPQWTPAQRQDAAAGATDGSIWLLSSGQAIDHLAQLLPQQNWRDARALVTHPRLAAPAQALGFGQVRVTQPVLAAVMRSIKSWP